MPISDVIKRRRKNTQKISWEIFHAWISEENNNLVNFTYKANNWWLKMIAEFPKTLRQCKIHLVDDVERDWNCRVKRNILIDPSTPPIFEHIQWKFHFHASAFFNKISTLLNFSCWCDGDDDDRLLCDVYTHFHDIEEIFFCCIIIASVCFCELVYIFFSFSLNEFMRCGATAYDIHDMPSCIGRRLLNMNENINKIRKKSNKICWEGIY